MSFTLYNAPQSTCSQRVRFTLHAKGLEFQENRLDLFSGDQLKPEYLAINPNGVVPALVHDDVPVIDSAVIMEYLEDIHPNVVPMRPKDPKESARMRAMLRFIDEVPAPAIRIPSYNLAFLPHFQAMSAESFQTLCDSKPLRREFLMKMGRSGFPQEDMDEALGRLGRAVTRLNDWLIENGGPWMMGHQLTYADIALMPVIVRMDDINLHEMWADKPMVSDWLAALKAHPAFEATYYHGSLLTEKYPHLQALRDERAQQPAARSA
ncbi:glutathione S-transferase family protein [Roseibium sp. CAU 1637]|uniref:Glutathione S-transferase family protein n=1 Tax=Roseibium limicola TaxID=2816037 RepID=A0A939EN26_9HYPH|nr:glutathione S-transferase family protein [Roseibium limicola]MBO0344328.1 glutathione S-transferase family protein [Roseibium limicola]